MDKFEFEGGLIAEIENTEDGFSVIVVEPKNLTIRISGFPNHKAAHSFVMFGDFDDPKDNDFIRITRPQYQLKWEFGE